MSLNVPDEQEKELTPKQQQVILLLAKGATIVDAAKDVGISEKTLDRWKTLPAFKAVLRLAEDELYSEAMAQLKKLASKAIECLERNMNPEEAAPYVQVAAASKLLDAGLQVVKVQELEKLLADFETRLQDE
jgi:transposase